jgi:hypothetical protein
MTAGGVRDVSSEAAGAEVFGTFCISIRFAMAVQRAYVMPIASTIATGR